LNFPLCQPQLMARHILVTGGAGYIGSHMCKWLAARGHGVDVLDNLSTGHREAVRWGRLIEADLRDAAVVQAALAATRYDAVMHFSACSIVADSVREPYFYYANNVAGTLNLLEAMRRAGVERLVFSSTASVYGEPQAARIDESHATAPANPYGASKWMIERMLADAARACGLRSVSLRYFNAAGASPDGDIGESHDPETHLIPNVLRAALGSDAGLRVFGDDYPTPDGTCVRDYVHVDDLAQAHELALGHMDSHTGAWVFNLGNGAGFSVREVIEAARRVTGADIPFSVAPRREGDTAMLVASSERALEVLGWAPVYTGLDAIIETAWRWERGRRF
jgi:UDP-glucose 4-epimerase